MAKPSLANPETWPVELLRVIERAEAERLSSLSWDTIKRRFPEKIVKLSERRRGIRVGDVLMLGKT